MIGLQIDDVASTSRETASTCSTDASIGSPVVSKNPFHDDGYEVSVKNTFLCFKNMNLRGPPRSRSVEPGSSSRRDGPTEPYVTPCIDEPTTLMLHGVPSRRTLADLMAQFTELGFTHAIDLAYMPQRPLKTGRGPQRPHNFGYAFINFTTPHLMQEFKKAIKGHPLGRPGGGKCDAVYAELAKVQGRQKNLEQVFKTPLSQQEAASLDLKSRSLAEVLWVPPRK